MKEYYLFWWKGFEIIFAVSDGTDGWLWTVRLPADANRKLLTDLFTIRIMEDKMDRIGVEVVFLIFFFIFRWDLRAGSYWDRDNA